MHKFDDDSIIESGLDAFLAESRDGEFIIINFNNYKMQNFLKYVLHSVVGLVILGGISLVIGLHPAWFDVTVGSLVVNLYNFLITTQGSTSVSYK